MGLLMRKNDRSFSSGGAPSPKKARLGSFVDLSRGARESSVKPHVLDNGTYRGARTSTRRGIGTRPRRQRAGFAPIERDFRRMPFLPSESRRFERFRRRFTFASISSARFVVLFLFVSRIDAREPTRLNSTRPARCHTTTKTKLRSK
jgi:hypothetical protein